MVISPSTSLFFSKLNKEVNFGHLDKLNAVARKVNSHIFLVGKNYTPDPEKWDYVWFSFPKLPKWKTLDFVLEIINITSPNDVWIQKHKGLKYLALDFD